MKVTVEAIWDQEAGVWSAASVEDIGLITEAATIEELQRKLAIMIPELLDPAMSGDVELELVARSKHMIAAE